MSVFEISKSPASSREFDDSTLSSIVQVFCTSAHEDYFRPWHRESQKGNSGSGFVVSFNEKHMIITNYHVIQDGIRITIEKRGDSQRYTAEVVARDPSCDLALLHIKSKAFWKGCGRPLERGPLPKSGEDCWAVGFPLGGTAASVTRGICSRVDMVNYLAGQEYWIVSLLGRGSHLLAVQVDAGVNSGNSGGPVFNNKKEVIGVAFQSMHGTDGISFAIPWLVVDHFLRDIAKNGKCTGFPVMPFSVQLLENRDMRASLGMYLGSETSEPETGVLISEVLETPKQVHNIRHGDIILKCDGKNISNQGRIELRPGELIDFAHLASMKFLNDFIELYIIRDGQKLSVSVQLTETCNTNHLISTYIEPEETNKYLIIGGLVFLKASGEVFRDMRISALLQKSIVNEFHRPRSPDPDLEVIILSDILDAEVNCGYKKNIEVPTVLKSFNGAQVTSLKQLSELIEDCDDDYLKFCLHQNTTEETYCILERIAAHETNQEIACVHKIAKLSSFYTI